MIRQLIARILELFGVRRRNSRKVFTTDRETVPQFTNRDIAEYWTGAGVNYRRLWGAYQAGYDGYVEKYKSRDVHLFVIEFEFPPNCLPLFDHETVLKTLKGLFHDLKRENLSAAEYDKALPLFLYAIERGSGIYKFLGELRQLLMFGTVLGDEQIMAAHLESKQKRIDFLRENFPTVSTKDAERFVMAKTNYEMDEALQHLMKGGIRSIRVSAQPVSHLERNKSDVPMVELKGTE